ncbi:OmpA family protein [Dongia sedimenti]|uniref:OmpA family protein n=1 Tax=Dongia sedimenti TaxID=3064282 RepID=A0ABU0YFG8_9PROT|nr:OmpA family protein [Rhodospirillaceae bacterium R-7]
MTLRAGRRAFYLGFAALCGIGGSALPAAAQSYLADNGNNVTVDYSVLGQGGPGPVTRGALPNGLPGAMPAGSCSCANAPLGVIAAAPRPTFTNPFGAQVTQAPAVPPGFMAYSQVTGSSSSGGAVVLRQPSGSTQMAANEAAPVEQAPALPATTPTANDTGAAEPAPSVEATLPATTPTQSAASAPSGEATAPSGGTTPPAQPEEIPATVPSPVEQPPVAQAPEPTPAAEPAPAPSETQTAEATPETPPAASAATSTQQPEGEQQAAVTPPAPAAEGTTPPAESGGALPAGATRILYTGQSDDVPATATAELDTIAQDMLANQDKRIQVMSYAAGTEDTESKARRKSLARGLAIRSYLMKSGVPSTRIDVRALGNKAEGGPADRVDIIPAS